MSIEEHAQNILTAREQCDDYNHVEYVKEEAQAILDAMRWVQVADRLSDDEALVMVRLLSGTEEKSWYEAGSGWLCEEDHPDDPVVAWRELI